MSDDVLQRARLLAQAANVVAAQLEQQALDFIAKIETRHKEIEKEAIESDRVEESLKEASKPPSKSDIGSSKVFKCAAINGSSLLNTYSDIRPFTTR